MVAWVHVHHRNLCRVWLLSTSVFIKQPTQTLSQFGGRRGSINLSLIEIVQMEAWGSPMLVAVHRGVNYDPVSLCGLVALPCQSLTCSPGFFHFKTTILQWSRSNRAKVKGYCATKWFITTSTARTPSYPSFPPVAQSLFAHAWPHTLQHTSLWLWQGKCAPPLMCPLVWNAY